MQFEYSEEESRCMMYEPGKVTLVVVVWLQLDTILILRLYQVWKLETIALA